MIAEHDGNVAGLVSIMFLSRLNQKNYEMYIPELIVTEDYQNQGIGKNLINSCIKLAKEKKCYRIKLESGNQRKESHQFFKNFGAGIAVDSYKICRRDKMKFLKV